MNGIINVLKPAGMTSFDVVSYLRRVSGQKKVGHTGTLDPAAVGVLPICLGNATKAIEFMIDKDKKYRAELTLGLATDTQDSSGSVLYSRPVAAENDKVIEAINSFMGEIEQLPPMYSAIKIGGKKLYELARQGETIERETRKVHIYSISIIKIWDETTIINSEQDLEKIEISTKKVLFDVTCSKGTYIRTLCHDIGEKLGCGGLMSFLVRTNAGKYSINTALSLEEIRTLSENNELAEKLISVETVFDGYDCIALSDREEFKYNNGILLEIKNKISGNDTIKRVYDKNGAFLGIGEIIYNGQAVYLKSKKFFK